MRSSLFCYFVYTCRESPVNPTPASYLGGVVDLYSALLCVTWETVTFVEGISCWGLLRHTLANGVLVYPSQSGKYSAEGCIAVGYWSRCI